ncbi:MAG TPA: nitronate monooxygenase [Bacillota bacterium]|nr:nitronate monooxygenase [Bacillota bacterium]
MWNKNNITEILNIKYPIIQAGMAGGIATPELVASVSNSSALGSVGAGYMSPGQMRESIQDTKQLTDKPFAVNIFFPENPVICEEEVQKANEWLRPYREELGVHVKPEVSKQNDTLFEEQVNVS